MSNKVLIVDDDKQLLDSLSEELTQAGFLTETAVDGKEAMKAFDSFEPDVLVLDITLPTHRGDLSAPKDGLEVLARVRSSNNLPIIMLSNTSIGTVKVMALDMGADDYVTKPFDAQELIARIHAALRRSQDAGDVDPSLEIDGLLIDPSARTVHRGEEEIPLTAIEFDLLYTFASRPGHVFTRDHLLDLLWRERVVTTRVVDVHIGKLRKKIQSDPDTPSLIQTVRSVGFRLDLS